MSILSFPLFGVYNGGLNTRDDPRALPLHKTPYCRNVELRRNRVEMTPGYTAHAGTDSDTASIQGMFVARTPGNVWLMKADGGKIKKLKVVGSSTDAAWVELKTGLSTTAQMEFCQAGDHVYGTNGTDAVQSWDLAAGSTTTESNMPKGTTICYFNQRVIVNDTTDRSKLWFSPALNYNHITDLGGFKYVDSQAGGEIKRVMDTGRFEVLIMKDTGRYGWDGVDTSTSNPKKYSNRGTNAPRSVVVLPDGTVIFCDHEGVWLGNVYSDSLLSDEIGPTWAGLNHGQLDKAAATYQNDQYLISVADSGASVNNLTLVYDFQLDPPTGGWLAHNFGAPVWVSYVDSSGINQEVFGSTAADSKVYRRYLGTTSSDFNFAGGAINAVYYTKEIDFKELAPTLAAKQKAMVRKNVSTSQEGSYYLTLGWRKDNDADFTQTLWSLASTAGNWSATDPVLWSNDPGIAGVWGGGTKNEGLVTNFKLQGRTYQGLVQMNAINQPFKFYGEDIYLIPLKSFK